MTSPQDVAVGMTSEIESLASGVSAPFAALLVCEHDADLARQRVDEIVERLLSSGCRYFVCSGGLAEELHDLIDAALEQRGQEDIVTTFHPGESPQDVAEFFLRCASIDMRGLVALVGDKPAYVSAIGQVLANCDSL